MEQSESDSTGSPVGEFHARTYSVLGLDSYPLFDETYRATLNDKIINHFMFREIGFETVALFRHFMKRTLNEIMPYYNQLYMSEALVTNPMLSRSASWNETWTRDLEQDTTDSRTETDGRIASETRTGSRTHEGENERTDSRTATSEGTDSRTSTDNRRMVHEDTPMGSLDPIAFDGPAINYATTIDWDHGSRSETGEDSREDSSTGTANETVEYTDTDNFTTATNDNRTGTSAGTGNRVDDEEGTRTHTESGYDVPQAELLKLYRETFINIDYEIIQGLESLFMQIW